MSQNQTKWKASIIISCFLLQIFAAAIVFDGNFELGKVTGDPTSYDTDLSTSESPSAADVVEVDSWWNTSYQFRRRIEVENPLSYSLSKPVEVTVDFTDDTIFTSSVRIVQYDEESDVWTSIPCQLYEETTSGNFVQDTSIKFVGQNLAPGTNIFYIYYDDEDEVDPTDYTSNTFVSNFDGQNLTVDWDDMYGNDYQLTLNETRGASTLSTNGINFHTENSTAPGVAITQDALVGYWPFDGSVVEQTGVYLDDTDTSYIPNQVKLYGDLDDHYEEGVFGESLVFDGNSDYIEVNSNEDELGGQSSTDGFSVMAWVYMTSVTGERIIASWDRSEFWRLAIVNGEILWATYSEGISDMSTTGLALTTGKWYHIAATYEPATRTKCIYVDGVLEASITAHNYHVLGYGDTITRYGFIGTGSEESVYGSNTNGPTSYFYGRMDELRIYNTSLAQDEVEDAMNKAGQQAGIANIDEVYEGEVFSQYEVQWEEVLFSPTEKMTTLDTWTFYRSMNQWEVSRTYYWNFSMGSIDNMALWNSLYSWNPEDLDPNTKDYYYYDGNLVAGHDNVGFTPENYTVLHDYDGDNYGKAAIGLFVADIEQSVPSPYFVYDYIKWKTSASTGDETVNFLVGDQIDFNNWNVGGNPGSFGYTWEELNLTIDFWEYIRYGYNVGPSVAQAEYDNLLTSVQTSLVVDTNFDEESVFYNYEIEVLDHEGSPVPNVNVSLYNYTTGPYTTTYYDSSNTDVMGKVLFSHIPQKSFTVNLTFSPYSQEYWLDAFNITISPALATTGNSITNSTTVNLTTIVIQFVSQTEAEPCAGAVIGIRELNESSEELTTLGIKSTNSTGHVKIWWFNQSSEMKLDVNVSNFLGSTIRQISDDDITYAANYSIGLTGTSAHQLFVQIQEFETSLVLTDLTPSYIYGSSLVYEAEYSFDEGGSKSTINGSQIGIGIYQGDTLVYENLTYGTTVDGNITINIDYVNDDNINFSTQTGYTLQVYASKEGYTSLSKTKAFTLVDIASNMVIETISGTTINNTYWNENFTLSVYYEDGSSSAIDGATITYDVPDVSGLTGTLLANPSKGAGWYSIEFNTSSFGATGLYSIFIVADKETFELQEDFSHKINILDRTTQLIPEDDEINTYWQENFTINVQYLDARNSQGIDSGATLSWSLAGNAIISGDMELNPSLGVGWYSAEVNTTVFSYAGFYSLAVSANKDNYQSKTETVILRVQEIYTLMNNRTSPIEEATIYRTQSALFEFEYTSKIVGSENQYQNVINASYRTFEWSNRNDETQFGTGDITYNETTGKYVLDFDTATRPIGEYAITIRLQEINYITRVAVLYLNIIPREFDLNIEETGLFDSFDANVNLLKFSALQDENVVIRLDLSDKLDDSTKSDATVVWIYGEEILEFESLGNGMYELTVPASVDAFYQQQVMQGQIRISAFEFTNITITTQIIVAMPEIFAGVPTFYFMIVVIGVVAIVGTLAINRAIQNARIPGFVKLIEKQKKVVGSGKEISAAKVADTKEAMIYEMFAENWSLLGLDLKSNLGLNKPKQTDDNIAPGDELGGF